MTEAAGFSLQGRKAFVTGASRGIGRGIALAMAAAGADVAINYRREREAAEATVKEIEARGRRGFAFAADVRDGAAVHRITAEAREALGGLDVVVANAGVATRFQPLHETDPGYWQRVIDIDLHGVFHTIHAALPFLRAQKSGVILTISSIAPDACAANGGPYVAAKAAVNALTKVVARENSAVRVRANVIAPGLIATDIADGMIAAHGEGIARSIPLGRMGTPEEVGQLAVYLASDAAAWITGKVFRIDGGAW
ncbi:MAG TPA: glucose 1-dehydrogenase [Myxococcota bacterium]|jgi:NAD(P)-dependent dehydrogenase (short-subunit alcohol dehydrogenase family)|nr:glucose 1-dehydrogenase [Myxococcota bacterium]